MCTPASLLCHPLIDSLCHENYFIFLCNGGGRYLIDQVILGTTSKYKSNAKLATLGLSPCQCDQIGRFFNFLVKAHLHVDKDVAFSC